MNGGIAVVVAHPDDEILWLSSVLGAATRVVFCFGDPFGKPRVAASRRRAVAALGLPGLIDLAISESGAGFSVDWRNPAPNDAGVAIIDPAARARYQANRSRLGAALREALAGCDTVHTHNPWGEYGHAEHIQVYRAVAALQAELGYTIGFTNYVSSRSWPLARQLSGASCWTGRSTVRPDIAIARRLMRIYLRHGAWTWTRWHRWPAAETLYLQAEAGDRQALNGEILLDVADLRRWPPFFPHRRVL